MGNSCHFSACVDGFVHGELEQYDRREFEQHLSSCGECRKEIEIMRRLKESILDSYGFNLDETFNYSVINTLREEKHFKRRKEVRIAVEDIIISLATLVAIVLLGFQLFGNPRVRSVEMVGRLTDIEKSSLEQTTLSNDQVLELVLRSK